MQRCEKCSGEHHILLHIDQNASGSDGQHETQSTWYSVSTRVVGERTTPVLLMTAIVNVRDRSGQPQQVRALLDSASKARFVSENILQRLGLHKMRTSIPIAGISTSLAERAQTFVEMEFRSMYDQEIAFSTMALTGSLPSTPVPPPSKWKHLTGLKLGDSKLNIPGAVDILLGADVFGNLLQSGRVIRAHGTSTAMETTLGWFLMGQTDDTMHSTSVVTHLV
jgi:hypothetical protein